jgi:hypothetical protein
LLLPWPFCGLPRAGRRNLLSNLQLPTPLRALKKLAISFHPPPNNPTHAIAISHAIVDEHGLIYAVDRETGGLYILKYTGSQSLD